jgi:hypothetical protein
MRAGREMECMKCEIELQDCCKILCFVLSVNIVRLRHTIVTVFNCAIETFLNARSHVYVSSSLSFFSISYIFCDLHVLQSQWITSCSLPTRPRHRRCRTTDSTRLQPQWISLGRSPTTHRACHVLDGITIFADHVAPRA